MPKRKYTLLYYIGALTLLLLTACKQHTVYYHYEDTPVAGWEKNDTLTFYTEPVKQTGQYSEKVGLRISSDYPFLSLQLIVDQEVLTTHESRSDTLSCSLVDEQGNIMGPGISTYQYEFPLTTLALNEGDRLQIVVHHDMKREILPGISNVGISLTQER